MRLPWLLFASSVALLFIIVAGFFLSPSARPAAQPHSVYTSMEITDRGSRDTLWLGYSMALAILAVMTALVLLGVDRNGRGGVLARSLVVGFACLALLFTGLVVSYASYAGGAQDSFFGGLPRPTAWMIYGVWLFPMLMLLVCAFHFDRWYFTEEDERSIEELMRSNQTREEETE